MPDAEGKAAHLQMIQGVISRMASNSFSLKTLSVTFTAAVLAYLGAVATASRLVPVAAGLGVIIFWWLDAQYLRLEKLFRALYDCVREKQTTDYSMDTKPFNRSIRPTWCVAFSWSVVWLYLLLLVVLVLLVFTR